MKKRFCYFAAAVLSVVICTASAPFPSAAGPVTGPGAAAGPGVGISQNENTRYQEVSGMADAIAADMENEGERKVLYGTAMANVFGSGYRSWEKTDTDFAASITGEEFGTIHPNAYEVFGHSRVFVAKTGGASSVRVGTGQHVPLNEEGINEQAYNDLKLLYDTAELLKAQTAGMGDREKIRLIRDHVMNALEYEFNEDGTERYYAARSLNSGRGACEAYSTLICLFGRHCGLDVRMHNYRMGSGMRHSTNCIYLDGVPYYIDATWDDVERTDANFLMGEEAYLATHDVAATHRSLPEALNDAG